MKLTIDIQMIDIHGIVETKKKALRTRNPREKLFLLHIEYWIKRAGKVE